METRMGIENGHGNGNGNGNRIYDVMENDFIIKCTTYYCVSSYLLRNPPLCGLLLTHVDMV
jgi:hypothetical protein